MMMNFGMNEQTKKQLLRYAISIGIGLLIAYHYGIQYVIGTVGTGVLVAFLFDAFDRIFPGGNNNE
jgi:hypothetical protein